MTLRIEHRPRARADLLDIWHYIAAENEPAADRTLARIGTVLDLIGEQPNLGRARPELGVAGLRSHPVGNYVVFYLPSSESITVVRVLDGHRDIQAVFSRNESQET